MSVTGEVQRCHRPGVEGEGPDVLSEIALTTAYVISAVGFGVIPEEEVLVLI